MTDYPNTLPAPPSPPDLGKLVREEVDRQLSTQRQVLNDAIGLATKIVGVAFAILIGIFTVFGLTTWKDIKVETAELVKKQTEELLKGADAEMGVKSVLTNLINRAVVASTLVRTTRSETKKIAVTYADWTRLRTWITIETLELQDFIDALTVLNLQDEDRKASDARKILAKMLEANPESQFRWIRDQPDKVNAILSVFKHKDLAPNAIALLKARAYSEAIGLSAAKYPREVDFKEGADKLLEVYDSLPWGEMKRTVLSSIVALRPEHPGSVKAITAMLDEPPQLDRLQSTLDVLLIVWPVDPSFDPSLDVSKIRALGPRLVDFLLKNGARLELQYSDLDRFSYRREEFESKFEAQIPELLFWLPTIPNSTTGGATGYMLSLKQFAALNPFWDVVDQAANAGQQEYMAQLLPSISRRRPPPIVRLEIGFFVVGDDDATIEVVRDSSQSETLRVGDLRGLYVLTSRKAKSLQVSWMDRAGLPQTGLLKSIKGTSLRLRLQRAPTLSGVSSTTG